ncbi:TolC family protein [Phytohalomonas tamaricis]|uniref:TolC family protein n=1 Tax=Phytohalomonas tamaricis TaxID=2081032 RepID=UPI001319D02D|nr:TolC family protein [Phytohalomonas tamaricis]
MKPIFYALKRSGHPFPLRTKVVVGLLCALGIVPTSHADTFAQNVVTHSDSANAGLTVPVLPAVTSPLGLGNNTDSLPGAIHTDASVPSLPVLFAAALDNADDLKRQRLEAQAQGQDVAKAWAGLKPSLDVSYAYSYTETDNYYSDNAAYDPSQTSLDPLTGETITPYDEYDARYRGRTQDSYWQARLSQPLFSVERWRNVGKANAQRDAAQLQVDVAEHELALQTAEAYMNAFFATQQTRLLDAKRESLELQIKQASRAYELGIGDRIDMLAAQSRLDQAAADRAVADNQRADALSVLERLTGMRLDFNGFTLHELAKAELPEPVAFSTLESHINDNRQVILAQQQLEVARAEHGVRQGEYYPEVNMSLTYGNRHSNDVFRESEDVVAAVQASMNLYQGGYTSANVRQAELLEDAQTFAVSHQRKMAWQELRRRHRNITGDLAQLQALKQSIRSSELYLEAADKGAALGLRDLVDVLDARADLFDQRIQYVDAFRRLIIDRLAMQVAIGALSTADLDLTMTLIQAITTH